MLGQMMTQPLLISSLVAHAERYHSGAEIYSVNTSGGVEQTSWGQVGLNARKLACALSKLGLEPQARCGTIAWNNRRHVEIYYGVSGGGYVCHTINPRMGPEQMVYVINHAQEGQGPFAPMEAYLDQLDPLALPETVIWEIPVRYLTDLDLMVAKGEG